MKISKRDVRETAINTIAIGLTSSGAIALQAGNYVPGIVQIAVGALLEYWKYHLRHLGNKIK